MEQCFGFCKGGRGGERGSENKGKHISNYLDAYKDSVDPDKYDKLKSYIKDFDDYSAAYSDNAKAAADMFSQFKSQDEYDMAVSGYLADNAPQSVESAAARKKINEQKKARIDEIKKQLEGELSTGSAFLDWDADIGGIFQGMSYGGEERINKLKNRKEAQKELDRLEAEVTEYERTQGKLDSYYAITQNEGFGNSKRDYGVVSVPGIAESARRGGHSFAGPDVADPLGTFLKAKDDGVAYEIYNGLENNYGGNLDEGFAKEYEFISRGVKDSWDKLDPTETEIYYWKLQNEGRDSALKFLEDMTVTLNKRETEEYTDGYKEADLLKKIAFNAASIPASVLGGGFGLGEDIANLLTGEDINPYSKSHAFGNFANAVRTETAKDIDEWAGGKEIPLINFGAGDAYQSLMSMGDMFLGGALGPEAYGYLMGTSAAQSKMKELYEQGASEKQILAGSLLSGAAEMVFEEVSLDKLLSAAKPLTKVEFVKQVLAQAGVEGSEEFFTDLANGIIDSINRGSQSDIAKKYQAYLDDGYSESEASLRTFLDNMGEAGSSFLGGALSGGLGVGIRGGIGYSQNIRDNARYVDSFSNGREDLYNQAREMVTRENTNFSQEDLGRISKASDKVEAQSEKRGGFDKVSSKNIGKLNIAVENAQRNAYAVETKDKLIELGMNEEEAYRYAKPFTKELLGEELNEDEQKRFDRAMKNEDVMNQFGRLKMEYDNGTLFDTQKEQQKVADFIAEAIKANENVETEDAIDEDIETPEQVAPKYAVSETGEAALIDENGERTPVNVEGIKVQDGTVSVTLDNGTTAEAQNIEMKNEAQAVAVSEMETFGTTSEIGTKVLKELDHFNITDEAGANNFMLAYSYGIMSDEASAQSLDLAPAVREAAYNLGKREQSERIRQREEARTSAKVTKGTGNVTYYNGVNAKNYTGTRKATLQAVEHMAKQFPQVKFHLFESYQRGGNNYINVGNGEEQSSANGFFQRGNEIYIDINAGDKFNGVGLFTLSHEMSHLMRQWSPASWQNLADAVVETVGKNYAFNELVEAKYEKYRGYAASGAEGYKGKTAADLRDMAYEDTVCDALSSIMAKESTFKKFAEDLQTRDLTGYEKFKQIIRDFLAKIKDILASFKDILPDSESGRYLAEAMEEDYNRVQDLFVKTFGESVEALNEAEAKVGVDVDSATESASPASLMSERTWTESEYVTDRDAAAEDLAKALGVSVEKAKAYIDNVNSIAKMIAEERSRLDYSETGLSPFIGNVEYGGSFDYTTLCKKRRLLTGTFSAIQNALPNTALTAEQVLEIRKMMDDEGLEVSCGKCYVEGSRANMGYFTKKFIELYRKYHPGKWYPNLAQMNTPDGIENVRITHPEVYDEYEYFWNHYGTLRSGDPNLFASQQKPKLYQMRSAYNGEILKFFKGDTKIDEKNRNGGIRMQSFSDFEIVHLIDAMQTIMDMSRVGLYGQAYTKVPEFALALGDTGLKINLSIDAWSVGEDGKLVFNNKEGMPFETAMELRNKYSKNVGTICCVYDDAQLLAALADDRIDFVIPFHRSQWKKAQYKAMGLPSTTKDYTYQQNEKWLDPSKHTHEFRGRQVKDKCTNYMPNEYWDFSKTGKENAEEYLRKCAEDGKRPKFYKFLDNNGDGSYSLKADGSTDGYWKLLIDFKMYDNDGVGSKQTAVTPNFNMEECYKMLNEYKGGHEHFPVAQGIVDEFVEKYKAENPGRLYSERSPWQEGWGNGYDGYSMSNNARAAYASGEKPLSKWTKAEIISSVAELNPELAEKLKAVKSDALRSHLLTFSSWHHTSSYYNQTDFYSVDEDILENITDEDIAKWAKEEKSQPVTKKYRGDIDYIEWQGTRKHPKAVKRNLTNVNIEERGSFYVVTDDNGKELLRKKIGSNGTEVTNYIERDEENRIKAERENAYRTNSSKAAYDFYTNMDGRERSQSGHVYERGRKPTRSDYDDGIENFFKTGEQRIYDDSDSRRYVLETWDGKRWVPERSDAKFSERSDESMQMLKSLNTELKRENKTLKADLADARELVRLQGKNTRGGIVTKTSVQAEAKKLMKANGVRGNSEEFARLLGDVYQYILDTEELTWSDIADKAAPAIQWMRDHEYEPAPRRTAEAREALAELRKTRISLSETQRAEIKSRYGSLKEYFNTMRGKVILTNEKATPLDTLWGSLAGQYPQYFDEDVSDADEPELLLKGIRAMQNSYEDNGIVMSMAADAELLDMIYDGFWEVSTLHTVADRYERRINQLKKKHADQMTEVREDRDKRIAKVKQDFKDKTARSKERRETTELRHKIARIRDDFNARFKVDDVDRAIPQPLVDGVIDVCNMIDPTGADQESKAAQKYRDGKAALLALKEEYDKIKSESSYDFSSEFDAEFSSHIAELADAVAGRPLRDMTHDELQNVYDIMKDIQFMLSTATKQIGADNRYSNYEIGEGIIEEMMAMRGNKVAKDAVSAYFRNRLTNPLRAVAEMTGFDPASPLMHQFRMLDRGLIEKDRFFMQEDKKLQALVADKAGRKAFEDAAYKAHDFGLKDAYGKPLKISKMQAMQMILTWERETANKNRKHLSEGGTVIPDIDLNRKGKFSEAKTNGQTVRYVDQDFINTLYDGLNEWDKKYLKTAREIFNVDCKDAINRVTMQTKGRPIATEKAYIPYEIAGSYIKQDITGETWDGTVAGSGFLKEVKNGARQMLVMQGLNYLLDKHITGVSKVVGLAIPVRNFNKVWNVIQTEDDADATGIQRAVSGEEGEVAKTWGKAGVDLIEQAVSDIQARRSGMTNKVLAKARNAFVSSTLNANISVTIKQAASYPTAGSLLSTSSLTKGLMKYQTKILHGTKAADVWSEIDEHTPMHYMRRLGYSTEELGDRAQKRRFEKRLNRGLGKLAPNAWIQGMDVATTAALWYATKEEVKKNGVKEGDASYWNEVTKLYEQVIEETQPMYDPMHRAELTKEKGGLQSIIMFQTQPLQNSGILRYATMELKNANKSGDAKWKKAAARKWRMAVTSQVASHLTFSAMTLFAYLVLHRPNPYRDEDGELTFESILKKYGIDAGESMLGAVFPVYGYYALELADMIFGDNNYDVVSDSVVDMVNDSVEQMRKVVDSFKGNGSIYNEVTSAALDIAQYTGIPAKNFKKLIDGLRYHIEDAANGEFGSFEAGYNKTSAQQRAELFDDATSDDEAFAERLFEMNDNNKARKQLDTEMKQSYLDGEYDLDEAEEIMEDYYRDTGKEPEGKDDPHWKLKEWEYIREHGNSDGYNMYNDFYDAVESGKNLKAVIKEYTENGKTEDALASQISKHFKPIYSEMSKSEKAGLKGYLLNAYELLGKDRARKSKDIDKW